jgi:hypothetical protein
MGSRKNPFTQARAREALRQMGDEVNRRAFPRRDRKLTRYGREKVERAYREWLAVRAQGAPHVYRPRGKGARGRLQAAQRTLQPELTRGLARTFKVAYVQRTQPGDRVRKIQVRADGSVKLTLERAGRRLEREVLPAGIPLRELAGATPTDERSILERWADRLAARAFRDVPPGTDVYFRLGAYRSHQSYRDPESLAAALLRFVGEYERSVSKHLHSIEIEGEEPDERLDESEELEE